MNENAGDQIHTPEDPDPTQYMDYRKYLSDWYSHKKSTRTSFSGSMFAKKANIKSHSLLGMIIRGERNLTYKTIHSFITALGLKREKAKYFENLVLYNQARTYAEKVKYLDSFKPRAMAENPTLREVKDKNAYFSAWHVVAIRELALLPGFKMDPEWIARKLKNKITPNEAEAALELLKRLELLQVTETGVERPEGAIVFLPDTPHLPMREFHKSLLNRSIAAVDGEPMEEREMDSVTLAVTLEELEQIKTKLRDTLSSIVQDFIKEPKDKRHVIAVHVQTLQLTSQEV